MNTADRFSGRIAVFYGDSITYGAYTGENDTCPASRAEKRWCDMVSKRLGFSEMTDYSESGISVSATSPVRPEAAVSACFDRMRPDAGVIFIAAGTNDFGTGVKPGKPDDNSDVSFTGAVRKLCRGLREKYPHGDIVFVLPIDRYDREGEHGYPLSLYRDILRKIAGEEYRFTVIDGGRFGINASDPDFVTKHMKDGVHPDPVGQRIYADGVIEALTSDKQHRTVYDK